jgi:hypothetical protein
MYSGEQQHRGSQYSSATPSSPPLHHPVPQHPIPPFRSPPPSTASSSANKYASAAQPSAEQWQGQQQSGSSFGGPGIPGFGGYQNLFTDPSAQLGIEVGRNALNYGQEYIGKSVSLLIAMREVVTDGSLGGMFQ